MAEAETDFDALEEGARKGPEDRPDPWKPDKDEALRGHVREIAYPFVQKADEHRYVMTVEREDGEYVNVWLSSFVLTDQLLDAAPAIDSPIVIVYLGKRPNKDGTREYNAYSVSSNDSDYAPWAEARVDGLAKAERRRLGREDDTVPVAERVDSNGNQIPEDAPF